MAASGKHGIQGFCEHRPDVTLMDLRLPDLSGIDALIAIRSEFPGARIIMLTAFNGDVDIQRALGAGADGYLLKSTPRKDLLEAIRRVQSAKKSVPPEVAAQQLFISEETVNVHVNTLWKSSARAIVCRRWR